MGRVRRAITAAADGLPTTFWWLWAGMLVSALATFVFPFLAFFLTSRGFTPLQAGLAVSLFGAGGAIASPVAGHFADRIGRRPTLLGGLVASAAIAPLLGALRSLPAICVAVFAFGFASSLPRPAISATVADVVASEQRHRAFGLLYWANNVGIGFSLVVGGMVAARSWLALFLADAATTFAFAATVWRRVPETRPATDPTQAEATGLRAVLADPPFVAFLALHLAWATVLTQFLAAAPIDMAKHGLSAQRFGLVFVVNAALIAVLQPWSAKLTHRFASAHVLAAASVLLGAGYAGYAFCSSAPQYALATAVLSLGEIGYIPTASALVADLSPSHLRGRYQGAYSLCWALSSFAAPVLGSAVLQRFGGTVLWSSCLGVGLVCAAGQLALGRARANANPR